MEEADGDKGLAEELRQRQVQEDVQVVQPSNIAATFDLDASEAPLQALFTNVGGHALKLQIVLHRSSFILLCYSSCSNLVSLVTNVRLQMEEVSLLASQSLQYQGSTCF